MSNHYAKRIIAVICLTVLGMMSFQQSQAQCAVSITPSSTTVCAGSPVTLTANFTTATTQTVFISAAQLFNLASSCDGTGVNRYNGCSNTPVGFDYTDPGPGISTVTANVKVEFYVGIECATSFTHVATINNNAASQSFTSPYNCICTPTSLQAVTLNFTNVSYNIGGANSFRVTTGNCFGFSSTAALSNAYAKVTVTYNTAVGSPSFSWSTGATGSSITVNPSSTTTYSVNATASGGCNTNASATVNVNALPTPAASNNGPVTVGGTLNLGSTGGTSYSWTGPNAFSSTSQNPSISSVGTANAGTYTVTVTNASGCSAKATTTAVVNASSLTPVGLPSGITAAAAYSTRKVNVYYAGPVMNVRRASDNAQADVAFDANGTLSAASMVTITAAGSSGLSVGTSMPFSTFYGTGDVYVAIYYDQSSNGRHAVQATAALQPQIIAAGVINTLNGKPAVYFTGSASMTVPFSSTLLNAQGTFSVVQQQPALQSGFNAVVSWSSAGSVFGPGIGPLDGAGKFGLYTTFGSASYVNAGPVAANTPYVIEAVWTGNGASVTTTRNGGTAVTGSLSNLLTANISNGTMGVDNGGNYKGYLPELIILPTALSATDRQSLEANQVLYYMKPVITAGAVSGSIQSCFGTASASPNIQQFAVSGNYLTSNISLIAPAGFEISTAQSSGYSSSLTLTPAGGVVSATTIYVRSASAAATGTISGSVNITATNATTVTAGVTATVNAVPAAPTVTGALAICAGNTTTLTASGSASSPVYNWYDAASGGNLLFTGAAYTTPALAASQIYYTSVTSSGCTATARTATTVNVTTINDAVVSASTSTICGSGTATISVAASQPGVLYTLRNNADNTVVAGPLTGNGGTLNFSTGMISSTKSYNVFAKTQNGGTLTFDGLNKYVTLPFTTGTLGIAGNSFTVGAWIYRTDSDTRDEEILGNVGGCNLHLLVRSNRLYLGFCGNDLAGSTIINANQWYHVAFTYNASTGVQSTYVNGVLDATGGGHSPLSNDGTQLRIGGYGTAGTAQGKFAGNIDELQIWNSALSAAQISSNMNSCLAGNESGLLAYYNFEEGTGGTLTDRTGHGFSGTLTNMSNSDWANNGNINCSGLPNCSQQLSTITTITVNPLPTATVAKTNVTCPGGTTGSITVTSTSGTAPFQYSKDGGGTYQSSNIFSGLSTGSYPVYIKDANGCSASVAAVSITQVDNVLPVITAPANVLVTLANGNCTTTSVSLGTPVTSDNCSVASVTNNAPATYPLGVTTVTWTVKDNSNNTATATQTVTVVSPEINLTGNGNNIPKGTTSTATTTNTDFGTTLPGVSVDKVFVINNTGTSDLIINTITSNNAAFTAGGLDLPVTIAANSSISFIVSYSTSTIGVANATILINNNDCDEASYDFAVKGQVTCTAPSFANGNVYIQSSASANTCDAVVTYALSASGAPSPAVTYSFSGATTGTGTGTGSGQTFNVGVTHVVTTATNACGTVTYSFDVTVVDDVKPVAKTKNITVYLDQTGHASVSTADLDNGSYDNCGPVTLSMSNSGTICGTAAEGSTVTLTAPAGATINGITFASYGTPNGSCGNFTLGSCNASNSISIVSAALVGKNAGSVSATNGVFGDPCGGTVKRLYIQATYSGTGTSNSFDCSKLGDNTVTFMVTDAAGNVSTATAIVTVVDNRAPVITCGNNITVNATSGSGAAVSYSTPTATDNCSAIVSRTAGLASGATFPIGVTTVTHTATDPSGNSVSCSFTVTVNAVAPVINCPSNIVVNATAGQCGANVSFAATETTGRPASTITYTEAGVTVVSGSFFSVGVHTITATATNTVGTSTCSFTITVKDNQAPVLSNCPSNVTVTATSASGAVVNYTAPTATDNCSATITRTAGLTSGSTFPIGTTTVTHTATDAAGNSVSCSFTVTVNGVAPVIVCPANITVNNDAGQCGAVVNYAATETTGIPAATITYSTPSGSIFAVGTKTVTATATNAFGSSSCSFIVTVKDVTPPVIVCAGNITVNAAAGQCNATVTVPAPAVSDNCDATKNSLNFDGINDYVNIPRSISGDFTIEYWMKTTQTGPSGSQWYNGVGVVDAEVGGVTNDFGTSLNGSKICFGTGNPDRTIFSISNVNTGQWVHVAVTRKQSTGQMILYINGVQEAITSGSVQTLSVPSRILVGVMQTGVNGYYNGNIGNLRIWNKVRTATEIASNMSVSMSPQTGLVANYEFNQGTANGNNAGITSLVDNSGNNNNGTLNNFALSGTSSNWTTGVMPASVVTLTNSFNNAANASGTYPVGTTNVVWTATDAAGNSATCTQTVTVIDNQPPTITCPSNINVYATSAAGAVVTYTAPVGTDNCSGTTTVRTAGPAGGSTFPIGTTTVTHTSTDAAGNSTSCSFTVTVTGLPPVISCPANIVVNNEEGQCGAHVSFAATETTAIPASTIAYTENGNTVTSGDFFSVGIHTIVATATNPVGTSTCSFTVTVNDNEKPVITAPGGASSPNDPGQCTKTYASIGTPVTGDNCGVATVTNDHPSMTFPVGTTIVTWTVTDVNGNQSTATQTITVIDNEKPVVTVTDITQHTDLNQCGATIELANPSATDNCGVATITNDHPSTFFPTGTTVVTWTVTDVHGWSTVVTQNVIVNDLEPATVITKNITISLDATGHASITTGDIDNGTNDACGVQSLSLSKTSFDCSNVGDNTVTLTATDVNGNVSNATAVVTVKDVTPAVVITKNITISLNATGHASITTGDIDNGTNDACGVQSLSLSKTSFDCSNVGNNTVTLTATDVNGNVSSAAAAVTVKDVTPATVITKNITISLNAMGYASITAGDVDNGTNDACGVQSLSLSKTSFDCSNVGDNTVTLTATDVNGNVSSATAVVTVKDVTPAVVITKNITISLDATGHASITAGDVDNGTNDACGVQSLSLSKTSFDCSNVGDNTVTLTATDVNGNVSSATAVVKVKDVTPAVVITKNITISLDATGHASITTGDIDNGTNDACGVQSLSLSKTSFDCSNVGNNTVTLTATDVNGNISSATAIVTVKDVTAPVVITKNVVVYLSAAGTATITAADVNNGSTDACGIQNLAVSKSSFTCSNVGANAVILTVTDINGNVQSAGATVTVKDTTAPAITAPSAQTFCANANGSNLYNIPAATGIADNCSVSTISYTVNGPVNRTGTGANATGAFGVGISTITWTVTDVNGNSTVKTTTVTVNPLPSASYVSSNADAFCNQTVLTGSSSINSAGYSWTATNAPGSFSSNAQLSLGLNNADGNYYLYVKANATGCVSATAAVYNYQKQNLVSSYTLLAYKEVDLGKYNKVVSGSIGIMTAKGEAEFKSYSSVNGAGAFVKSPQIDKDGTGIVLNSQIIGIAAVTLPTMQYNTATTNNLPNYTANVNNATISGNYKNLQVKKGVSVTVTGNTFGNVSLEEGASIRFTSSVLNIDNFTADRGAKNTDYSYIRFAPGTSVRVSNKVSIGSEVYVNPEGYKVTIYMADNRPDEEKFTVKGGDTRVVANVLMPNGKIRVTSTDSDDDNHANCNHQAHSSKDCNHKGHDHNDCDHKAHNPANCGDDVYMTGLFIAEEIESKGNTVIWSNYDCSAPPAPVSMITGTQAKETVATSETVSAKTTNTEEELKVTVMPNPSTTYFTLKLESKYETPVNLRVMDGRGRVVDARSKLGANSTVQIGHNYSSGTYYAELIQGNTRKVVQLIKGRG